MIDGTKVRDLVKLFSMKNFRKGEQMSNSKKVSI